MPPILAFRAEKITLTSLLLGSVVISLSLSGCASNLDKKGEPIHVAPVAQMFRPAQEALHRGDYDRAIRQFQNLQTEYPYGPYSEQSQLDTAYAYYKSGDSKAAAAAASAFIKAHRG